MNQLASEAAIPIAVPVTLLLAAPTAPNDARKLGRLVAYWDGTPPVPRGSACIRDGGRS